MEAAAQTNLGEELLQRWGQMCGVRAPWQTLWQQLGEYLMPRKFGGAAPTAPGVGREARLFDTTAIHANTVLANGQLSWAHGENWFAFTPPAAFKQSDEAKRWFQKCTMTVRDLLANSSNFYTSVHEFYLDRSCFGTAALYVEPGKKYALNFKTFPLGSFAIDEDDEGNVDTVFREFKLSARQAEQRFGVANLGKKVLEALNSKDATQKSQQFTFIHAIYPRSVADIKPQEGGPLNMPIASVYVEMSDKHVCQESGYAEMPAMVSRFLEWNSGLGGLYGWSPAWAALPEAKQLNLLQMWMDALAEKAAFPAILKPASMEGEIDLSAGAINEYDDSTPNPAMPKEFATGGAYELGLQRIQERQEAIRKHFHVDLFQMFGQTDGKNVTATWVNARMREQVAQISPSFTRLKMELHTPLLQRVFSLCLELGYFEDPPQELVEKVSPTMGSVATPLLAYQSRFDIEMRGMNGSALESAMVQLQAYASFDPGVIDNVNLDEPARDAFQNNGLPVAYLRPVRERDQLRQQRQQAQAEAAQMQQAEAMSKAAGNIAKVEPEKLKQLAALAA